MKILQINSLYQVGSTGRICEGLSLLMDSRRIENRMIYWGEGGYFGKAVSFCYMKLQALYARILGNWGRNSYWSTRRILRILDKFNPDIVHLHEFHSHLLDFKLLLEYLAAKRKKVVWTFHDCWGFTGYCPYFTADHCDGWEDECRHCALYRKYSWFRNRSHELFLAKKNAIEPLDLVIVSPSCWLDGLVARSFLKSKRHLVIPNGIDLDVFRPRDNDFRQSFHLKRRYIVLGVSAIWNDRKGIDVWAKLPGMLGADYQLVLVGTDRRVEAALPPEILSIRRTSDAVRLAEIYSAADVFVNTTREDNFPTVNLEALACGTPVVTFAAGGSAEMLDPSCGIAVPEGDIDTLVRNIRLVCEEKPFTEESCVRQAGRYNMKDQFGKYLDLYQEIYEGDSSPSENH